MAISVVFRGAPREMIQSRHEVTGAFLQERSRLGSSGVRYWAFLITVSLLEMVLSQVPAQHI